MPSCSGVPASSAPRSFNKNGTPRNGPSGSAPAAVARARSKSSWITAFSCGLSFSIRVIASATSSAGDTCSVRTSSACAVASSHAPSALTRVTVARRTPPRPGPAARPGGLSRSGDDRCRRGQPGGARADGHRFGHAQLRTAAHAAPAVVELAAAALVLEDHRALALDAVAVGPLPERHEGRPQVGALLGQAVLAAQRPLLVRALHEDALVDESLEAGLEDVAGDAQVALDVVEGADAHEGLPDDQEGPTFSDDLEGGGHRAVLVGVVPLQHPPSLAHNSDQCVVL